MYSITSAIAQSTSRNSPCANPPAIQKIADTESQAAMRMAFRRVRERDGGVRDPQKDRLADLHRRIGDGKPQSTPVERSRDRGRQHQPAQHHCKQQQPDRRLFRIEPVGDPGGEDPHPPHREKQQRDLKRAQRREMREQRVRHLRDRKDEDEVEEQLGVGDAAVLVRHDRAKQRAACIVRHRCAPPPVEA